MSAVLVATIGGLCAVAALAAVIPWGVSETRAPKMRADQFDDDWLDAQKAEAARNRLFWNLLGAAQAEMDRCHLSSEDLDALRTDVTGFRHIFEALERQVRSNQSWEAPHDGKNAFLDQLTSYCRACEAVEFFIEIERSKLQEGAK